MNAHNLYTNSLSFWPICQRRSTDIPLKINGQRIGRVLAAILTETSADSGSLCRPSLSQYTGWYISRYIDQHISVDISTDTWLICWLTYRPTLGRYVDRYIGRVSANMLTEMSTDISVEGCTKYTLSQNCCGMHINKPWMYFFKVAVHSFHVLLMQFSAYTSITKTNMPLIYTTIILFAQCPLCLCNFSV